MVTWATVGARNPLRAVGSAIGATLGRAARSANRTVLITFARFVLLVAGLGLAIAAAAILAGLGWSLVAGAVACWVFEWIISDAGGPASPSSSPASGSRS